MVKRRKATKPKLRRVAADDCVVTIDDAQYYPHVGEWVDVRPGLTVGEMAEMIAIRQQYQEIQATQDDADIDNTDRVFDAIQSMKRMCERRVVRWNWTEYDTDVALPQPSVDRTVFDRLHYEELFWLLNAVQGVTATQEGED